MRLSVIIPIFNERPFVPTFLDHLRTAPFEKTVGVTAVEFLFVNDGSTDGTKELLEKEIKAGIQLKCGVPATATIHSIERNRGKGFAVRRGIAVSTGDVVVIQDADLEYSPNDFPTLLGPILNGHADVVYGSRFVGLSRRVFFFWHAVMNRLLTFLTNMVSDLNLTDMGTGYKAFRGSFIRNLQLKSDRFGIEPEITIKSSRAKARIFEVPVQYSGRSYEEGKKIRKVDGIAAFFHVLRFGFFDREYYRSGMDQSLHALDRFGGIYYAPLLHRCLRVLGRDRQLEILEMGSGIGTITKHLFPLGDVFATDISKSFTRSLQDSFGNRYRFRSELWDASASWPFGAQKFDLIVAFNLLEHLENDRGALENWKRLLKPNGAMAILVPNHPWLFSNADRALGHFRRYSPKALQAVLDEAGLETATCFLGNPLGVPAWFINQVLMRREELPQGQVALYARIKWFIAPFEAVLAKFIGLNLVVLARPKAAMGSGFEQVAA